MKQHHFSLVAQLICLLIFSNCSAPNDEISPKDDECMPATTCPNAIQCGKIDDGCGGTIDCGTCTHLGEGTGCLDNQCKPCTATKTCLTENKTCGKITDDCGNIQDCGSCSQGMTCSQTGTCELCTPKTCNDLDIFVCGKIDDGCGGTIDCGCPVGLTCADDQRCTPCEEHDCSYYGAQCGLYDEGCGRNPLSCGNCPTDQNCVNNRCVDRCVTTTAEERCSLLNAQCGDINDGCGEVINCGRCNAPDVCQADHTCKCEKRTCASEGVTCGEIYDGCGGFETCGNDCVTDEENSTFPLRILAGNLTSGPKMNYDQGHGIRIFQGLKPHIALIQEFNYGDNSAKARREMVSRAFGENFYYVADTTQSITIPNGVVSLYPIKKSGIFIDNNVGGTRNHVWAQIDIPGKKDLWVVSVHMHTKYTKRLPSMEQLRQDLESLNIPKDDFLVIGGDFNTSKFADGTLETLANTDLIALDTTEAQDFPIDQNKNGNTSAKRTNPLDGIYTSQNLKNLRTTVVIGTAKNLTDRGLVFDSREFTPLSAVAPVQKNDSAPTELDENGIPQNTNMQHMAVVKDFAVFR